MTVTFFVGKSILNDFTPAQIVQKTMAYCNFFRALCPFLAYKKDAKKENQGSFFFLNSNSHLPFWRYVFLIFLHILCSGLPPSKPPPVISYTTGNRIPMLKV